MKLFFITITSIFLFSCTSENNIAFVESKKNDLSILVGDFNNFQQFWLENTEDELHREKVNQKHEHIHLKIKSTSVESSFDLEMYTGRKNDQLLGKKTINFAQDSFTTEKGILKSLDGTIKIRGDTLWIDGLGLIPKKMNLTASSGAGIFLVGFNILSQKKKTVPICKEN